MLLVIFVMLFNIDWFMLGYVMLFKIMLVWLMNNVVDI